MKIKICLPAYSSFDVIMPSLRQLILCKDHEFVFPGAIQSGVPRWARNAAINDGKSQKKFQKLDSDFTHYLTLDPDIVFSLDSVLRALLHDKPVCAAPYPKHNNPTVYECGAFIKDTPGRLGPNYQIFEHGLKKIDWAGTGFLLIKAEVFEKLEYPWFRQPMIEVDDSQEECSEDIGFCVNLMKHEIDLWCDFDIRIAHIPHAPVNNNIWKDASKEELLSLQEKLNEQRKK